MLVKLATVSATVAVAAAAVKEPVGRVGTVDVGFAPAFLKVWDNRQLFVSTFYNEKWAWPEQADATVSFDIDSTKFPGSFEKVSERQVVEAVWPNEVVVSTDVFETPEGEPLQAVSVAGGFIKRKGEVHVSIETQDKQYLNFQVSPKVKKLFGGWKEPKWMYHRAEFVDMDGDGHLDLLTARSDWSVPPLWSYKGQVVWFKNPGTKVLTPEMIEIGIANGGDLSPVLPEWEEFIIDDGSKMGSGDVNLRVLDLDGDGTFEIICTHFWDNAAGILIFWDKDEPSIVVYSLKDKDGSWADAQYPDNVDRVVVAKDFGGPFDIELHDMNGDGRLDLLTSNHAKEYDGAGVFVFEIPSGADWVSKPWIRHDIRSGLLTRVPEGMSPGAAQAFHPSKAHKDSGAKPWVLLSGDGTGYVHLLRPLSEAVGSWDYEHLIVYDTALFHGGAPKTTGAIALSTGDLECTLAYVPVYEGGQIVIFSGCELEKDLDGLREQTKPYDELVEAHLAALAAAKLAAEGEKNAGQEIQHLSMAEIAGAIGGGAAFVVISAFFVHRIVRSQKVAEKPNYDMEAGMETGGSSVVNPKFNPNDL